MGSSFESSARSRRDGRQTRWDAHRAERRAELIAVVVEAVNVHGPSLRMDDIAAFAGITKPVFYRYFSDKTDLYRAVGAVLADTVVGEIGDALQQDLPPAEKLRAAIDAYVQTIESQPSLYELVLGLPPERSSHDSPIASYATTISLHLTRVLREALRDRGLDAGSAEPWAFGIVGLIRAAVDRWFVERTMTRQALVDYLGALLEPRIVPLLEPVARS